MTDKLTYIAYFLENKQLRKFTYLDQSNTLSYITSIFIIYLQLILLLALKDSIVFINPSLLILYLTVPDIIVINRIFLQQTQS